MSTITLTVNGHPHAVDLDPTTPLLYVLSDDLALRGPKFGCGLGQCGACTVIVDGRAIRSCVTPVGAMGGAEMTTLEGLGSIDSPHPIQKAFIDEQAAQCGFCLSGVILTAKALVDPNPKPPTATSSRRCRPSCAAASCTHGCCAPSNATRGRGEHDRLFTPRIPEGSRRAHRQLQRAASRRDARPAASRPTPTRRTSTRVSSTGGSRSPLTEASRPTRGSASSGRGCIPRRCS